ncbi:glycerol kinase GlpK [Simiduia sp. 21SJ11W-1]|uniref:glycerol kinase GlpK n=1 Tax=Simiduia sp. 21SJ11W-1 TaxID=2909669 RepID=UPI00209EF76A|nr:glycerol kinase GlpK [Simiduia sp. 21SJ11W-1]UTA49064.1 glycerol kinase GlpK [Simiduia sp. 21SJ11W-1]
MSKDFILAIDQGTTSSRALIFNRKFEVVAAAQESFQQHFPQDGWVEHDAEEIWQTVLNSCRQALSKAKLAASQLAGIGITNQRETTLIWHRDTGKPIAPAIVWQDRRTEPLCDALRRAGAEAEIQEKTGLMLDPYFSATKIQWLLDNTEGARAAANAGKLAFGTIDCWLLWQLTGGASHKTDATNASRTQLYNLHTGNWDQHLLSHFNIPESLLPTIADNVAEFGSTAPAVLGSPVPVFAMAGDQQAALLGQGCIQQGQAKCTFGTGAFLMVNAGNTAPHSQHRLLTTLGYRLDGKSTYAVEGSVFIAGAAVQWLRDGLALIESANECDAFMREYQGKPSPITLVPAFTGLGAPHWQPAARGAIFGLTRDTGKAALVVAALQSIALQTQDLVRAMQADGIDIANLKIDGGMTRNLPFNQCLADVLNTEVSRPAQEEMTVLGVAFLTALQIGWLKSLEDIERYWQPAGCCQPAMAQATRNQLLTRWARAIEAVELFATSS